MKIDHSRHYVLLAGLVFLIDRLTKYFVMYRMPHYQIHPYASIELVFNRGISFGLFHSEGAFVFTSVNILIGFVIALLATHTYARLKENKLIIGEVFIFAGAISNVIDRYVYGGVIDFIALSFRNWHFAVFNVADIFIFIGVVLMIILEYKDSCKNN